MAIIDPDGLFHGTRLSQCSDEAQKLWPRFLLASNGFGRIRLDYDELLRGPFASFRTPPRKKEVLDMFREYKEHYLAFPYIADGELWAQWDVASRLLPRYQTAADRRSPSPPKKEYAAWKAEYDAVKRSRAVDLLDYEVIHKTLVPKDESLAESTVSEISENVPKSAESCESLPLGVGVGVGVGDGVVEGKNKTSPRKSGAVEKFALPEWIPEQTWHDYEQMRRLIKKPMTDAAKRKAIRKLDDLRARGHPPGEVLEQSIFNSWQGLFEIREHGNGRQIGTQPAAVGAGASRTIHNLSAARAAIQLDRMRSAGGDSRSSHALGGADEGNGG